MQTTRTTLIGLVFVFAYSIGFTGSALAQDWKNIGPIVSGDMHAFVDYQVQYSVPPGDVWNGGEPQGPASYQYDANPLWVNVVRRGLSAHDKVFVQIISYERSCYRGECQNVQVIVERDLAYAESGRFTGQMQPLNLAYQMNNGYALSNRQPYQQELVVWINGVLYKDPQGRNLRFNMTR